jgi:DNA-directed RNA polymerase specialized sigma24 family protein
MNIAEHKLKLFRLIDELPEELLIKLGKEIEQLNAKQATANNKLSSTQKAYSIKDIQEEYQNAYEKWSSNDDELLTQKYLEGLDIAALAELFGRQKGGIRSRLKKLNLISD